MSIMHLFLPNKKDVIPFLSFDSIFEEMVFLGIRFGSISFIIAVCEISVGFYYNTNQQRYLNAVQKKELWQHQFSDNALPIAHL